MASLNPRSAAHGLVPLAHGQASLSEAPEAPIWAIMPYRGQEGDASSALALAQGLPLPETGGTSIEGALRIAWSGLDQWLMLGAEPDASLARHAALCDQSNAWCHLVLDGGAAQDVLARLMPIDLSLKACPEGQARRSLLGHMACVLLRSGPERFELLVFRSMAGTAVHELERAMRMVAARSSI